MRNMHKTVVGAAALFSTACTDEPYDLKPDLDAKLLEGTIGGQEAALRFHDCKDIVYLEKGQEVNRISPIVGEFELARWSTVTVYGVNKVEDVENDLVDPILDVMCLAGLSQFDGNKLTITIVDGEVFSDSLNTPITVDDLEADKTYTTPVTTYTTNDYFTGILPDASYYEGSITSPCTVEITGKPYSQGYFNWAWHEATFDMSIDCE